MAKVKVLEVDQWASTAKNIEEMTFADFDIAKVRGGDSEAIRAIGIARAKIREVEKAGSRPKGGCGTRKDLMESWSFGEKTMTQARDCRAMAKKEKKMKCPQCGEKIARPVEEYDLPLKHGKRRHVRLYECECCAAELGIFTQRGEIEVISMGTVPVDRFSPNLSDIPAYFFTRSGVDEG